MNFQKRLNPKLIPNHLLDTDQLEMACDLVDKLIWRVTVWRVPKGKRLLRNELFLVIPKEKQPAQWCVLLDMKSGIQSEYIANDPVALP